MRPTISTQDPADVFLALYDAIDDEPFNDQRVIQWSKRDQWVAEARAALCDSVVATGRVAPELVGPMLDDGDRGTFAALLGLDDALTRADVRYGTPGETHEMYEWAIRQINQGYLNSDPADGLLLYRLVDPPRPKSLPTRASAFGLIRVPPAIIEAFNISYERLPTAFDVSWEPPSHESGSDVFVGCAAMIDNYDELAFTVRDEDGHRRYRVGPRTAPLETRIRAVLEALDSSGATIAVLPEATLSDELLEVWKRTLRDVPAPWDSNLTWIVAGSGPVGGSDPPFNRSVMLLRHEGHELFTYDKQYDFTLTESQVQEWRLEPHLGKGKACEDIHRGGCILVRETRLGRIAVLICEDLTRITDAGTALEHLGVSHVFVPIFSTPINDDTWERWAGKAVVDHVGASVVIANSLAVGRASEPKEALGICSAVVPPEDTGSQRRPPNICVKKAWLPDEVRLLAVPAPGVKRFTD